MMGFQKDSYYINKVLAGDLSAYSSLVEKHKGMVYTVALRMVKNPQDAEEITQDAFLKAFRSLKSFKGKSKFSTWIYKIIYNTAVSRLRKKQIETIKIDNENPGNFDCEQTSNELKKLCDEDRKKYVRAAFEKLPEEDEIILTLYYLNESSVEEICEIIKLTKSNVKVKLHRARKKFYLALEHLLKEELTSIL